MPWRRVFTTNYDNIVETAYGQVGCRVTPATLSDKVRAVSKSDTICFHLNGFVDRLTRDRVTSELKLTDTSYVTAGSQAPSGQRFYAKTFSSQESNLFVGYSLFDLDIRRAFFDTDELRRKCFLCLDRVQIRQPFGG